MPQVLLIEGNSILSANITAALEMGGYQVDCVVDGQQALDFLTTTRPLPDIIVSEVMIPKVDGFKLLVACHEHIEWKGIPFVFLSALVDELEGKISSKDGDFVHSSRPNELIIAIENKLRRAT